MNYISIVIIDLNRDRINVLLFCNAINITMIDDDDDGDDDDTIDHNVSHQTYSKFIAKVE